MAPTESLSNDDLIKLKRYQRHPPCASAIRPAPTTPRTRILWDLLDVESTTGIGLTESCAMTPAASVSGFYFSHPEARYFAVGKIGADQVRDYAARKGMPVSEVEKWLAPNLAYEPE